MKIWHLGRIRQRRITRPDPHQLMTLNGRIRAYGGRWVDGLLRRHVGATAGRIEDETGITADPLVAPKSAKRERQQAMPARVLQRDHRAVAAAIEHNILFADGPRREVVL